MKSQCGYTALVFFVFGHIHERRLSGLRSRNSPRKLLLEGLHVYSNLL